MLYRPHRPNRLDRPNRLYRLNRDESGATAIEYGLIAALISLAAIIAFQSLGLRLEVVFQTVTRWMGG